MPTQRVAFTEWLPDQPTTANALLEANNVYPLTVGYGPFPLSADYSSAASEDLNNVTAAKFNLETQLFAGGATKLFKFNPATTALANVSKTGNYSSSERWSFNQFGSAILASNNSAKIKAKKHKVPLQLVKDCEKMNEKEILSGERWSIVMPICKNVIIEKRNLF